MARSSVQKGRRVFRFLPYVPVEIRHGILELPGKEIGHSAAEIKTYFTGTQIYRMLKVSKGSIVVPETALRDSSVMIAGSEDRIDAYRPVEILLRSPEVSEVVLRYTPEEEGPVVSCVELREYVEILYGLRIFPVSKGTSSTHVEDILVVLGMKLEHACT